MTKLEVIRALLSQIGNALYTELPHDSYSEYVKGKVTLRLDLVPAPKPTAYWVKLDLSETSAGSPRLEIRFKRKYARRQCIEDTEAQGESNAVEA
jgi:hypothetical protein